jgi:hypothetical protein
MTAKSDNSNILAKLDLRRYFLQKYHAAGDARVLDCFAGEGHIWNQLRSEFTIENYWGVDVKSKPGRIKIDSARLLENPKLTENVFDLESYGLPWKCFFTLLRNQKRDCTIFLTSGAWKTLGGKLSNEIRELYGLKGFKIPTILGGQINIESTDYCLGKVFDFGYIPIEAIEVENTGGTRYFGLRLEYKIK